MLCKRTFSAEGRGFADSPPRSALAERGGYAQVSESAYGGFFWRSLGIGPQPTAYSLQPSAFTLLEVILAMGVVTMLVLMIANMFQEVSSSYNIGTQSAEMNTAGRAGVDFIARELSQAVAGPVEALNPGPPLKFLLRNNGNELRFVALTGDPENNDRALRAAMFEWADKCLWYFTTNSIDPYNDDPAGWSFPNPNAQMLITNVTDFHMTAYTNRADLVDKKPHGDYDSSANSHRLPVCVDIYLEVLGNDDAEKLPNVPPGDQADFINRNARRYTTRVYFNNRQTR